MKGEVCGHVKKSEAHAFRCRRGVSQAIGAAIHFKLPALCQHEIVSGILKEWKQCGAVQSRYGCLVGLVCLDVRISIFAP